MTEGSIYSKRWRRWDAIMTYARGVMYIVLSVLVVTDYLYANQLAGEGVPFHHVVWTPTQYTIEDCVFAVILVVVFISWGTLLPVQRVLCRRLGWRQIWYDAAGLTCLIAIVVHLVVLTSSLARQGFTIGLWHSMAFLLWLLIAEFGRGWLLGAEALTRDQNRSTKPSQEPSPD